MTVLPAAGSDGVPPLQFDAIDQSLLVDPFQEMSAIACALANAAQQPIHMIANLKEVFTDGIPMQKNVAKEPERRRRPADRCEYHGECLRRQ